MHHGADPALRVLYVQPAEGFGGAERQGVLHVRRLRELGLHVVPVVGPGRDICQALEDVGVRDYVFLPDLLREIDWPGTLLGRVRAYRDAYRAWRRLQGTLADLATAHRVDVIFASRPPGWVAVSPVARRLGRPLLWRIGSRPRSGWERMALRAAARLWRPDLLVCNCEAVRRELAPLLPCPSLILRNGVDTARFDPGRVVPRFRAGLEDGAPVIGIAARPSPFKGFELLAEMVARTAARVPRLRVLVAGDFGWRGVYEERFRRDGLSDRVSFLGHVHDIESVYASCDVVVLTSRQRSEEGSPNAILEAMAMARPVVGTRVGGLGEIIRDGVEGFLVAADEPDAFAGRVAELLGDPALRRRMGAAGRAAVLERHDDRRVAAELADVLRGAAGQAVPAPRAERPGQALRAPG